MSSGEGVSEEAARPAESARAALRRLSQWWSSRFGRRARAVGFPIMLGFSIGAGLAAYPPSRDAAVLAVQSMVDAAMARPEFRINALAITGAARVTEADIVAALDLKGSDRAALGVDADAARARIEALGWVEKARVSLRPPQTLEIKVWERTPALLWRLNGGLKLLDARGVLIDRPSRRADWPSLPLIVGPGAGEALDEALALDRSARLSGLPIVGLSRVGWRRWDLELLDGPRVMLPEATPFAALEKMSAWSQEHDLLSRDVELVDLRLPHAPTVRRASRLERGQALLSPLSASDRAPLGG